MDAYVSAVLESGCASEILKYFLHLPDFPASLCGLASFSYCVVICELKSWHQSLNSVSLLMIRVVEGLVLHKTMVTEECAV